MMRFWRIFLLLLLIALVIDRNADHDTSVRGRIALVTRGERFDFAVWEIQAILNKAQQELFGYHAYISEDKRKQLVLEYFTLQGQLWALEQQIEAESLQPSGLSLADLQANYENIQKELESRRPLVEHIIEGQVSAVLQDEGFDVLGQIIPPVTMHFLNPPQVLVVSPRDEIRQYTTLVLKPADFTHRVALEAQIAQAVPEMSVWITRIGGIGVWPAMVMETDRAVVAFEITAHEWSHHYLIFFPLGMQYLSSEETRIINETTATVVGNEIGNKVIEKFYQDELIQGQVYLQPAPDYRLLLAAVENPQRPQIDHWGDSPIYTPYDTSRSVTRAMLDYLLEVKSAPEVQFILNRRVQQYGLLGYAPPADPNLPPPDTDQRQWLHHTRVMTDYLLALDNVPAAEFVMANGRQHTGMRVLNQAWFAFNSGYQDNPVVESRADGSTILVTEGGGGSPIGAAIYEIRARSGSLKEFLQIMRGITTSTELFNTLERLRQ